MNSALPSFTSLTPWARFRTFRRPPAPAYHSAWRQSHNRWRFVGNAVCGDGAGTNSESGHLDPPRLSDTYAGAAPAPAHSQVRGGPSGFDGAGRQAMQTCRRVLPAEDTPGVIRSLSEGFPAWTSPGRDAHRPQIGGGSHPRWSVDRAASQLTRHWRSESPVIPPTRWSATCSANRRASSRW